MWIAVGIERRTAAPRSTTETRTSAAIRTAVVLNDFLACWRISGCESPENQSLNVIGVFTFTHFAVKLQSVRIFNSANLCIANLFNPTYEAEWDKQFQFLWKQDYEALKNFCPNLVRLRFAFRWLKIKTIVSDRERTSDLSNWMQIANVGFCKI